MKIARTDNLSYVQLDVAGVEHEHLPAVRLRVVVDGDFSAKVTAWVSRSDLVGFVSAVEGCERTRSGGARLVSMSPGELDLRLEQCDGVGNFAVRYDVAAHRHAQRGAIRQAMSGEFPLDSERFGRAAEALREFVHGTLTLPSGIDESP